jgi:hypothetical protein
MRALKSGRLAVAHRRQLLVWRLFGRRAFSRSTETGYRYESDIRIRKECTTPRDEIDAAYRKVLAKIPAHDIKEIEWFD